MPKNIQKPNYGWCEGKSPKHYAKLTAEQGGIFYCACCAAAHRLRQSLLNRDGTPPQPIIDIPTPKKKSGRRNSSLSSQTFSKEFKETIANRILALVSDKVLSSKEIRQALNNSVGMSALNWQLWRLRAEKRIAFTQSKVGNKLYYYTALGNEHLLGTKEQEHAQKMINRMSGLIDIVERDRQVTVMQAAAELNRDSRTVWKWAQKLNRLNIIDVKVKPMQGLHGMHKIMIKK